MDLDTMLHSGFLLPVLAVLIMLDAPFPPVPSEPALMSSYGAALGEHAWLLVVGLFGTAMVGAVAGDLMMWRIGRTTRRVPVENSLSRWVATTIERRPGAVLIGARFVPGGRLVSTIAAGRYAIPLRTFLPLSLLTSAMWALYMLLLGLVLAPIIDGSPLRALAAGLGMAALVGGLAALVRRVKAAYGARVTTRTPRSAEDSRVTSSGSEVTTTATSAPAQTPTTCASAMSALPSSAS